MRSDAFATTLSALYGKLLVVMGIAFPMAEVISSYIPPSFYEGFYLYLYIGSMLFLLVMYLTMCGDGGKTKQSEFISRLYMMCVCVCILFFLSLRPACMYTYMSGLVVDFFSRRDITFFFNVLACLFACNVDI